MIAFDTDVLTGILMGRASFVERASRIASDQQAVPVIVIEEIGRGRLSVIRRALHLCAPRRNRKRATSSLTEGERSWWSDLLAGPGDLKLRRTDHPPKLLKTNADRGGWHLLDLLEH